MPPFPSLDWNPTHATYLYLRPESARPLPPRALAAELNLSRTNSMEGLALSDGGTGLLHAETTRADFGLRLGLPKNLEAVLLVPLVFRDEPVMDGFIGRVEEISWMKRMMATRQRYQGTPPVYEIDIPGQGLVRSPMGSFGLGDMVLGLKGLISEEGTFSPSVALRGGLGLPTGDSSRGFGSGSFDAALGVIFEKAFFSWLVVYLNLGGTLPLDSSAYLQAFGAASLALEFLLGEHFSLVVQSDFYTSPYKNTGIGLLDGTDNVDIIGLRYSTVAAGMRVRIGLFISENFNTLGGLWAGSANDFTVGATLRVEPEPS